MWITVVATLCLGNVCIEHTVTDQATQMECKGPFSQQALSKWMIDNGWLARGYTLQGWQCLDQRAPRKVPA
jgi:hypothetical protein